MKTIHFFHILTVTLLLLFQTACNTPSKLPDLESASSVVIREGVGGFLECDMLTFDKTYTLQRTASEFDGQANYEFGSFVREGLIVTETLTIPQSMMESFLIELEKGRLEQGEYVPMPSCVDGASYESIQINLENSNVEYSHRRPCGAGDTPWNVEWSDQPDKIYHVESEYPLKALDILSPYLLPEAEQKYWNEICSTSP